MVTRLELVLPVNVEAPHPFPEARLIFPVVLRRVSEERDVGRRTLVNDQPKIRHAAVALIRDHLFHLEVARRGFDQRLEVRVITLPFARHFDARNDVRLDAAHQVNLEPFNHLDYFAHGKLIEVYDFVKDAQQADYYRRRLETVVKEDK